MSHPDDARPWRSLDERLHEPPAPPTPRAELHRPDRMMRRTFLKLAGASAALSGLTACVRRADKVVPYSKRPPEVTPGVASFYATALSLDGYATGVLVESHEGRPTKIEGNPDHPASLGATSAHDQAAIASLYDPCRGTQIRRGPEPRSWTGFVDAMSSAVRQGRGAGLRLLLEPTSSPLVLSLLDRLRDALPQARIHFHAPLAAVASFEASRALFGAPLTALARVGRARVLCAVDADFLAAGPFHVRHAREFAERRRPDGGRAMNRLYVVEPAPTPTGAAADHRLARRVSECPRFLAALLAEVVIGLGRAVPGSPEDLVAPLARLRATGPDRAFVKALAADLARRPGESLVIVGERQPAVAHALGALVNLALGNVGATLDHVAPVIAGTGFAGESVGALASAIQAGEVERLAILEGNPVYDAPADLELGNLLGRVKETVYLGAYANETASLCNWFVPAAHALESWGDARALDGTASIVQPLIRPLWDGKTVAQVLAAFVEGADRDPRELVREAWRAREKAGFEELWRRSLERGVVPDTASPVVTPRVEWDAARRFVEEAARPVATGGLEIAFARDAAVHDGRFTNNPWLLELPDPLTKLTWDKAALVSPRTAKRLGVETENLLDLELAGRTVRAPVFVLPGHVDDAITLPLGYGRDGDEALARGLGFNAYRLRTSASPWFVRGVTLSRVRHHNPADPAHVTLERHPLATTQAHDRLEGRDLVRTRTLEALAADPGGDEREKKASFNGHPRSGPQWGMAIDLNLCNGCNACVVACQAENNVPVVGKPDVLRGREMHWLRIDRYFEGPPEEPSVAFEPMLCQHCEKAPCEYVCPVNATVHSPDGLNEQVYNRCVGTRFCSNNCPYKVRRFNWFDYATPRHAVEEMKRNPDVTVRERGVMEKCTFCVQRIRESEIRARREGRPLGPNDVRTACQQACPASAIVFGSLTGPASAVARGHADRRAFAVLDELGTEPRVRYLTRVKNPNPEIRA